MIAPEGWDKEEMYVLPQHTKVVVTGNNRTKSVLVGLHGVVKKVVGLRGWHWLRNALCVIETPSGNEDDNKFGSEDMQWNSSDVAPDDAESVKRQRSRNKQSRVFHSKSLSRSTSCSSHSKDASPKLSREQLIDVVQRHFMAHQLDELQVIIHFSHAAKRLKASVNMA